MTIDTLFGGAGKTDDQRLQALKQKYQTVLDCLASEQARVHNVHVENDKLVIRATTSSDRAKNAVWDAIKRVDATYSDLAAEISVLSGGNDAVEGVPAALARTPDVSYTVKAGDTLSKIAQHFYGNGNDYMRIFNSNRDVLKNPDKISAGIVLKIEGATRSASV